MSLPPVNPLALFDQVRALWPARVILGTDALNSIYWPLDKRLGKEGDEWLALAAWAFHQSISAHVSSLEAGTPSLDVNDVCFSDFDRNMRENLADETWADDRDAYGALSN